MGKPVPSGEVRKGLKIPVWAVRFRPWALRLAAKIDDSGGPDACWPWTASRSPSDYGAFKTDGTTVPAHRAAFMLVADVPDGMDVCHGDTCTTRACCNPRHLYLATHAQNMADAARLGRMSRGEQHYRAKLTEDAVRDIAQRLAADETITSIARRHGVTRGAIYFIKDGTSWGHLTGIARDSRSAA